MSAPTYQDLYDIGRIEMLVRQPRLVVRDGDVSDANLRACAAIADSVVGWAAGRFAATFLDGARGDDATARARDRGVERRDAVPAVGEVTLTRLTSAAPRVIAAGTRIATAIDASGAFVTVTTDSDISFGVGVTVQTGTCTAAASGRAGNVAANTLTRILDSLPEPFTATNAAPFAGGAERESDAELIDRTKGAWQNAARGTARAVVYGAREGGAYTATLVRDPGTNILTVYVADAEGNANAALLAQVAAELDDWAGAADVVNVAAGVAVLETITVALTVRAGVAIPPLVSFVRAAIVAEVNRTPIGGTLYRDAISAAARAVSRDIVSCAVVAPAADVVPLTNQVFRTTPELVGVA